MEFGVNAYAFIPVRRYSLKVKRFLSNQGKYYIADHGLRQAIIGRNEANIELVLENIVLGELLSRGYEVSVGTTRDGTEIDFIAERRTRTGIEKDYFQVAYLLADEKTREREFRSLEAVGDSHPKFVLSLDAFTSNRNGIRHLNLIEWLLGSEI